WSALWLSFVRFLNSPMAIVTTVVAVIGILMDPTTSKFSDSLKVMNYSEPRKDDK
ncbi:phage holin, partial [Listeria monocytogenes]